MAIRDRLAWTTLPGAVPARTARVDASLWRAFAAEARARGDAFVALWASDERDRGEGFLVRAAFADDAGLMILALTCDARDPVFPSLASLYPAADRMERAARDLLGVRTEDGDQRPWLRHESWPADVYPLRRDHPAEATYPTGRPGYAFIPVEGDGVHEIPVGPVHAGIIEPGHFRFSVVGEKVLRLEERLGYVHKGIEKRFEAMDPLDAHRLAARVSGDSAVAGSWAWCMALEAACGWTPPVRALCLRALALERERIANHLGDLGALGNDAGFAFGLAQFSRLKEDVLRANAAAYGRRYLMDYVVPMGVANDISPEAAAEMLAQADALEREIRTLRAIYDDHAGVQDRFVGAGRVPPPLAARLGLIGLAGRASGQARDARCDLPCAPYEELAPRKVVHDDGDVAARVSVRFDELHESLRLVRMILRTLPQGDVRGDMSSWERRPAATGTASGEQGAFFGEQRPAAIPGGAIGIGYIEGWRGPVFCALELAEDGTIRRCHVSDPSWHNWPVLEHAIIDNIVPDFPLINKSFNLSYSGHDL
jgi:Ni,Fe-hydrogenase III large subunit/Ni,Fe-hydrogenase III component G